MNNGKQLFQKNYWCYHFKKRSRQIGNFYWSSQNF